MSEARTAGDTQAPERIEDSAAPGLLDQVVSATRQTEPDRPRIWSAR